MKMTNEQLAAAKDRGDWKALWPVAEEHAKHATLALMDEEPDDDTKQEAAEAAIIAMRDWDPLEGALSTHINMRVQQRIRNYLMELQTGGVGSRRQVDEGVVAEHQTLSKPIGENVEDEDDPPTWMNNLTYEATGNVPAGYGDVGLELQAQHSDEEIRGYLHGLSPDDLALVQATMMGDKSELEYAEEIGVHHSTVQYRRERLLKTFRNKAKTCVMECRGVADWKGLRSHFKAAKRFPGFWNDIISVVGINPIWSQVTGKVWNDWAWRPDIMAQASFKRWSLGVSRRKRTARALAEAA